MLRNCDGQVKEMWPEIQGLGLKNAALKTPEPVSFIFISQIRCG